MYALSDHLNQFLSSDFVDANNIGKPKAQILSASLQRHQSLCFLHGADKVESDAKLQSLIPVKIPTMHGLENIFKDHSTTSILKLS